jgi:hypothetical protein
MFRFSATLHEPEEGKGGWSFVLLPRAVSAKLPSRGQTAIDGSLNGVAFTAMLDPDGQRSHWLKVTRELRKKAGASPGDVVELAIQPARMPPDLRQALSSNAAARAVWTDITTAARHDWILWITSAKKAETRARRIASACDMLAGGKRRVCCFDRSGIHGGALGPPVAKMRP